MDNSRCGNIVSILSRNAIYGVRIFLLSLGLFSIFRLLTFFIAFDAPFSLPFHDVVRAFSIGLQYDVNILMFFLVPIIFASHLPWIGVENSKAARILISTIVIATLSLSSLSMLLDIQYMKAMGTRFFIGDLAYLKDFKDSYEVMTSGYHFPLSVIVWILLCCVIAWLVVRAAKAAKHQKGLPLYSRILTALALILILIAGGLTGFTTLRWGNAYFSRYTKLNELALNGPFVLYYSYSNIKKQRQEGIMSIQGSGRGQAIQRTRELLTDNAFHFTDGEGKSITRELSGGAVFKPRNIVIIIMESFSTNEIGAMGADKSLTPYFDKLAVKGLLFDNLYANGSRTNMGLTALLLSYPDYLPGEALMRSITYRHKQFTSIASLLKQKGYQTYYVTGGRLGFDNQEGFMGKNGFDHMVGFTDFNIFTESEKKGLVWTVPDEVIFDNAQRAFADFNRHNQNFLGVILTLSNHRPFMIPEHFKRISPGISEEQRAFMYSDWALGQFMEQAEKSPYFKNTIFVITADTGIPGDYLESQGHRRFHIPLLLYAPDIIKPGIAHVLGSQLDLMPTLADITGLKDSFEGFGKSLMRESNTRFSISKDGLTYHIMRDRLYIQTDFSDNKPPFVFETENSKNMAAEEKERLVGQILEDSRMFVQTSFELLRN